MNAAVIVDPDETADGTCVGGLSWFIRYLAPFAWVAVIADPLGASAWWYRYAWSG